MGSSGNLTALAQEVAEAELRSRGIDPASLRPMKIAVPDERPVSDFVTIFSTLDWHQAQAFRGRLEAEGIPLYVGDAHTNQTDPLLSPALGGFRIRVPVERAREAKEILDAIRAGKFALDE
jgi:Putative prokaryotic signal transducing protein